MTDLSTVDHDTWRRITSDDRTARIAAWVCRHFREPIHLEDAARVIDMAPTVFSRWFRHRTGVGFPHFVTAYRVDQAIRAMREYDGDIMRIATSVGFRSRATFQRAFLRVTGQTPSRYRRRIQRPRHWADSVALQP